MPSYQLRFTKVVFNDTGHSRTICQRLVEVEARGPDQAVSVGQRLFCSLEGVPDWWLRADGFELLPAPDGPHRPEPALPGQGTGRVAGQARRVAAVRLAPARAGLRVAR